jgi:hypothetical protein
LLFRKENPLWVFSRLPPISLSDMLSCNWWWRKGFWYLVVPFPPQCDPPPPLLGGLPAWTFVLALCFFFSSFVVGCFLFMEFGKVSSPFSLGAKFFFFQFCDVPTC